MCAKMLGLGKRLEFIQAFWQAKNYLVTGRGRNLRV